VHIVDEGRRAYVSQHGQFHLVVRHALFDEEPSGQAGATTVVHVDVLVVHGDRFGRDLA